jgi:alpha-tubulin suppressor-like RCC1 family protein
VKIKMKKQIKQLALFFCTLILLGNISFASADTASDTDTLLNWAESNYPTYFPTHQTTQSITPWLFRFYPDTNVYAGVNTNNNGVYVFGGPWGNVNPTYIDSLSNLLTTTNSGKLTDIISIVIGNNGLTGRAFALKADGTVWGWGDNHFGELGDGTKVDQLAPVQVVGLTGVTSVVSEASTTIVLKNDGTVWGWGSNAGGNLGDGTYIRHSTPAQINGLTDVTSIGKTNLASGLNHNGFHAIEQNGTLWVWGCQANDILDHTNYYTCPDSPHLPTQISEFPEVIDFKSRAVGVGGTSNSYFVLKRDGTVWAWGNNFFGQLGDGTNSNTFFGGEGENRDIPIPVIGLTGVKNIEIAETLAGMIVFALKEDGTVWAWGDNSGKQLGTGMTTVTVDSPTQVSGLSDITKIAVETFQRLALKNDGTVWVWGDNNINGAIGVEGILPSIKTQTPSQLVGLTNVIDIKTSFYLSYALKEDGTVWVWGTGKFKDGTPAQNFTPTQMCSLSGITDIAISHMNSLPYLLKNDGTVWKGYFDVCVQQ